MYRKLLHCSILFGLLSLSDLSTALRANPTEGFESFERSSDNSSVDEKVARALKRLDQAKKNYSTGKPKAAKRLLNKIIRKNTESTLVSEALAMRAQIRMDDKQWIKSFDDLQLIVDKHPQYENFDQVIANQFNCATALMEGDRGRIFWILPGFKQYSTAVDQFEQIIINAPYGDYAPIALMNVALTSKKTNNPENSIDALDRLINYYPQSTLAPDAYYNLAKTYSDLVKGHQYDQGSTRRAISYYEDFIVLFPQSDYVGEVEANLKKMENQLASSRLDLGDFYYYYRNNNTAALVFYNEAITIEPKSDAADEARLRIDDIEKGVRPISNASLLRKLLGVN